LVHRQSHPARFILPGNGDGVAPIDAARKPDPRSVASRDFGDIERSTAKTAPTC
jgi:hypothetical protein